MKAEIPSRDAFRYVLTIPTRWSDNDQYGHMNNVEYYRFFEAVIVHFYANRAGLDMMDGPVKPFAAESMCRFRKALSYPDVVEAAMRVEHIGNSSVRYGLALFRQGETEPAATGHWVHVLVDPETERPVPIPPDIRAVLEAMR